jgi:hypothetical protein
LISVLGGRLQKVVPAAVVDAMVDTPPDPRFFWVFFAFDLASDNGADFVASCAAAADG